MHLTTRIPQFTRSELDLISNVFDIESLSNLSCRYRVISDYLVVGGEPSQKDVQILKRQGTVFFINCLPVREQSWDEFTYVTQQDLNYERLSIERDNGIHLLNALKLQSILNAHAHEQVFLHCATGNRIGALIAVYQYYALGRTAKHAISVGEYWGLKDKEKISNMLLEGKLK